MSEQQGQDKDVRDPRPPWRWMTELGVLAAVIGFLPAVFGGPFTGWLVGVGVLFVIGGQVVRAINDRPRRD